LVFLATSSPNMHPLEPAFAKSKQTLRRVGARSWESVVAAVGDDLRIASTAADARAFFDNAGFPVG
jgi:hypothetical protein